MSTKSLENLRRVIWGVYFGEPIGDNSNQRLLLINAACEEAGELGPTFASLLQRALVSSSDPTLSNLKVPNANGLGIDALGAARVLADSIKHEYTPGRADAVAGLLSIARGTDARRSHDKVVKLKRDTDPVMIHFWLRHALRDPKLAQTLRRSLYKRSGRPTRLVQKLAMRYPGIAQFVAEMLPPDVRESRLKRAVKRLLPLPTAGSPLSITQPAVSKRMERRSATGGGEAALPSSIEQLKTGLASPKVSEILKKSVVLVVPGVEAAAIEAVFSQHPSAPKVVRSTALEQMIGKHRPRTGDGVSEACALAALEQLGVMPGSTLLLAFTEFSTDLSRESIKLVDARDRALHYATFEVPTSPDRRALVSDVRQLLQQSEVLSLSGERFQSQRNFLLDIAIACAVDSTERSHALMKSGVILWESGEKDRGMAACQEAVALGPTDDVIAGVLPSELADELRRLKRSRVVRLRELESVRLASADVVAPERWLFTVAPLPHALARSAGNLDSNAR